jgi:hypothetical protein
MSNGKKICDILKGIRVEVARNNDIPYTPAECHHKGECAGTCPQCEEEVRYIERQLDLRHKVVKAAAVISVSVGMAAMVEACRPVVNGMLVEPPVPADSTTADSTTITSDTTAVQLQ